MNVGILLYQGAMPYILFYCSAGNIKCQLCGISGGGGFRDLWFYSLYMGLEFLGCLNLKMTERVPQYQLYELQFKL